MCVALFIMRTRRHHNNNGLRQIKSGSLYEHNREIAKKLGIPYGVSMAEIDPRCYWVYVTNTNNPKWICKTVAYLDETQSGGRVNIFVSVVDKQGVPLSGKQVMQTWGNRASPDEKAFAFTENGSCNFPMSGDSSFSPDRGEVGTYEVSVSGDGESEIAGGMGLPLKRHVCYLVTFQEKGSVPPPSDYVTKAELPALVKQIMAENLWRISG